LTEQSIQVPAGFKPTNKAQTALLDLARRGKNAMGAKAWFRLDKLAMSPDLKKLSPRQMVSAAMMLQRYGLVDVKEMGAGKGTAIRLKESLDERAVRVPAGFEPSNKLQQALLSLLKRASKAKGPGGWYRLDKLAMSGDLQGVPFKKVYYAAMALTDFGKLSMRDLGGGKGAAVQLKESLDEGRPGPQWNPWPQKKTKESEFVKSLEDMVRLGIWSKETSDIVANIARAMKKGDKPKVKKLWKMLAGQSDVSGGLVNEVDHWLKGWMESVESGGEGSLDEAKRIWSANGYLEIKPFGKLSSKSVKAIKRYVLRWANGSERAGASMLPRGRRWKATDVVLNGGKLMVAFETDAEPTRRTVNDIENEVIGSDGFGGMLWQFAVHDVASEEADDLQMRLYGGYYQTDDQMNPLRLVGMDISSKVGFKESLSEEREAYWSQDVEAIVGALQGAEGVTLSVPGIAEATGLEKALVRQELALMGQAGMVARTAPAGDQWRLTHFGEACGKPHGKKKRKGKTPRMEDFEGLSEAKKLGYTDEEKALLRKMTPKQLKEVEAYWSKEYKRTKSDDDKAFLNFVRSLLKMPMIEAKEGGYKAKTPLEKMVGEMVLGQSGMWLTKPQMKAVIAALGKRGIYEGLDEAMAGTYRVPSPSQLGVSKVDHSAHPTVVEYAVREMLKGKKGPVASARFTAKNLNGYDNMFIDTTGPVSIDPKKLEAEIWGRLIDQVKKNIDSFKPGKQDMALGAAADFFKLGKRDEAKLKKLASKRLGVKFTEDMDEEDECPLETYEGLSEVKNFTCGPYSDPSAAHEKAMKIKSKGGKSIRVDKSKGKWVINYAADKMLHEAKEGGYKAKTPLEKMVGEMVLGQSGMWLTKPQMKAVIAALGKRGIKEPKEGAYDDIAREVGKILSKLMSKAA
jgi:hypothetical protein